METVALPIVVQEMFQTIIITIAEIIITTIMTILIVNWKNLKDLKRIIPTIIGKITLAVVVFAVLLLTVQVAVGHAVLLLTVQVAVVCVVHLLIVLVVVEHVVLPLIVQVAVGHAVLLLIVLALMIWKAAACVAHQ